MSLSSLGYRFLTPVSSASCRWPCSSLLRSPIFHPSQTQPTPLPGPIESKIWHSPSSQSSDSHLQTQFLLWISSLPKKFTSALPLNTHEHAQHSGTRCGQCGAVGLWRLPWVRKVRLMHPGISQSIQIETHRKWQPTAERVQQQLEHSFGQGYEFSVLLLGFDYWYIIGCVTLSTSLIPHTSLCLISEIGL